MKLLIQSLLIISCASIASGFVPSSNQQHNLPEYVLFAKGKKGFKRNQKDSLKGEHVKHESNVENDIKCT